MGLQYQNLRRLAHVYISILTFLTSPDIIYFTPKLPTWSRRRSEEAVIGVRFTTSALKSGHDFSVIQSFCNTELKVGTIMNYYVYMVRCKDNSLYTGISSNVSHRVWQHNFSKRGAKSLRNKLPVILVYSEVYSTKSDALKREHEIKSWKKEKKEQLIQNSKM